MEMQCRQFFQLLSDDTRLRSLMLLRQEGELCVCELVHALGVIQPKVSRHLAALRDCGVVADRRSGQWIYYQIHPDLPEWARQVIHPDLPEWARQVIDVTVSKQATREPFVNDLAVLSEMPNRPGVARCA